MKNILYAVIHSDIVIAALKKSIGEMITSKVTGEIKKIVNPLSKHASSTWRHLKPRLGYLKQNWWKLLKETGWSILWP